MLSDVLSDPKVEIAHVLTMDIVGYSTLLITEQTRVMGDLTCIVKTTARFRRGEAGAKLRAKGVRDDCSPESSPQLDPLRGDPRFERLANQIIPPDSKKSGK